ncbi:MAG TPA: hypothetical protein VMW73_10190 [Spirochaetia bacterium]|nr:hypothetical protein [Spirochaetia bacterium]
MTIPLLEMRNIGKRFSGVVALSGVDFLLQRGEVNSHLSENGAGKSTPLSLPRATSRSTTCSVFATGDPKASALVRA